MLRVLGVPVEAVQMGQREVVEIVEDVIEDNLGPSAKDEEELDEFELRLRRLSK